MEDEDLLIALLNSAPIVEGKEQDHLERAAGQDLVLSFGGNGSQSELLHLQRTRAALQQIIRGHHGAIEPLASLIQQAVLRPEVTPRGIEWTLQAPADEQLAVRAAMAWSRVESELPGRLRACANNECNLYLVDHSRPGTAKWCSMATCGNRMKVRAYTNRQRDAQ